MTDNVNVNVNIDEGMVNRLNPFFLEASDNVLKDMINYVEVLRDGLAISGIDENDMSIVQDEKLREGFKSALMFLDEKIEQSGQQKTE